MTAEALSEFLGWCTAINTGLILFSTIIMIAFQKQITSIHSKCFDISKEDLKKIYFCYLANYKIAIIIFNLTPWLALKVIA